MIVAGTELTIAEVSEQSRKMLADLQDQVLNLQRVTPQATLARTVTDSTTRGPSHSILWVDDNPKNNSFLVERLQELGIRVTSVLSTSDALAKLKGQTFDKIISDMGRLEPQGYNNTAGIDLIKKLHETGIKTPVAIYCSGRAIEKYGEEALRLGANEVTSSPTSLLHALQIDM